LVCSKHALFLARGFVNDGYTKGVEEDNGGNDDAPIDVQGGVENGGG